MIGKIKILTLRYKIEIEDFAIRIDEVVPEFYYTTDKKLWPAAAKSVEALLIYLEKENIVVKKDEGKNLGRWHLAKK